MVISGPCCTLYLAYIPVTQPSTSALCTDSLQCILVQSPMYLESCHLMINNAYNIGSCRYESQFTGDTTAGTAKSTGNYV